MANFSSRILVSLLISLLLIPFGVISASAATQVVVEPNNSTKAIKTIPRGLFSLNTGNESLTSLTVNLITDLTSEGITDSHFTTGSLNDLGSANPGLGVYKDGNLIIPTSTPTWTSNRVTFSFNPPLVGALEIRVNFSANVVDGSKFKASVPAN